MGAIALTETVQVCRTPLVKDCDVQGPEICRTEYESECWTKQEAHDVDDDVVECETVYEEKCEDETAGYTTSTKCTRWPKEVCSVSRKPVTKLVPKLKPTEECVDVPKEVCTRSRVNPRKVLKPVVKKWCYVPSEESGLA